MKKIHYYSELFTSLLGHVPTRVPVHVGGARRDREALLVLGRERGASVGRAVLLARREWRCLSALPYRIRKFQ